MGARSEAAPHLASIWESISDELGELPALVHGDRTVSWRQFDDRAARLASGFSAAGLVPGSVVAIDLHNCPEFVEVFYAAIKGGFVPTMVNYRYRADELRHLLHDAHAELVVTNPELSHAVLAIAGDLTALHTVLVIGDDYERVVEASQPAARVSRGGEGSLLSYTGGTTGTPKGVVYGIPRLTAQALRTREMVTGQTIDAAHDPVDLALELAARAHRPVCCPASPLMHSTAFTFVSLPVLAAGGTIVTVENRRFDPDALLDAVDRHAVTVTALVGDAFARPIVAALDARVAAGGRPSGATLHVMCSAGVAFSADTKRRLLEHLPQLTIVDACGSTEGATYGIQITRHGDDPTTETFDPAPGTIVVDDNRRPVPHGVVGQISALTVTSGYHRQPERTAMTFYDDAGEWRVIPGDFGRIERGRLRLLGRGSAVINTGGEKVYPEEVEDAIKSMPQVVDSVVWRVPDERLGSVVGAVVTTVPDALLDAVAVGEHVRDRLAGFKAPRVVVFTDTIPRHANGKLDTAAIAELLARASGR
jgi:acyl-CoA synthetase (AMP-forming)/AMP-acid ligase II